MSDFAPTFLSGGRGYQAHVTVDARQRSALRRIWRYVGYDEPNYTYTPSGRALLTKLSSLQDGPIYVRAHYLLCSGDGAARPKWGSTNVYTEDAEGNPVYYWGILDRIFDTYLELGCVPFVEIGMMPEALTSAPLGTPYDTLQDGGWRYPPKDYAKWQELISALARHCLDRYGPREVSRWYWELWNEPDIFYWAGTIEEYCRLYDHTVAALLSVLPRANVGGPATTNPSTPKAREYLKRFLDHCVDGTNAVSGERGTRLDFISFHTKGASLPRDPNAPKTTPTINNLVAHVAAGLRVASHYPDLARKEVILSECDPDGWAAGTKYDNPNLVYRNTEYYASFIGSSVCKLIDVGEGMPPRVDGMLTWAFEFEGREYFEGLRTLSTNGVDKPAMSVFRMLSRLGGLRLHLESTAARDPLAHPGGDGSTTPPDVSGIAAIDGTGAVQVFLTSHHDDWDVHTPTEVEIVVDGLEVGREYRIRRYLVDSAHGNSHTVWREFGEPQDPTPEQKDAMQRAGELLPIDEIIHVAAKGDVVLKTMLASHAVCLYELQPM